MLLNRKGLLAGASLVLIGSIVQGLTRVALNLLAGRSLGPSEFGQLTLCLSIAQFAGLLWPTSLGQATSKYVSACTGPEDRATLLRYLARRSAGAALVTSVLAAFAWLLMANSSWTGALITALVSFAYGQYHFTRGALLGQQQFLRATYFELLLAITCLVSIAATLATAQTGLAYAACLGLGLIAYAFGRGRTARSPTIVNMQTRSEIRSYILVATIGTVASSGFLQLSVVAASHWGGSVGVGLYGAALTVATPASIFATSLNSVLLPSLAAAHAQGEVKTLAAVTDRATRGINVLVISIFGGLVILADQVTTVLWGARFADSGPILRILLLAVMMTSCAVPCVTRLSATSTRSLALATRTSIIGVVIAIVLWVPLGHEYGALGIAWGYLIGASGTAITLYVACWRKDHQSWLQLTLRTGGALVIMAFVALLNPDFTTQSAILAALGFVVGYTSLSLGPKLLIRQLALRGREEVRCVVDTDDSKAVVKIDVPRQRTSASLDKRHAES